MAVMANVTVKKFDGITDIVWTAITGSGGDKTPAIWRSSSANTGTTGQKPVISMTGRSNADGTVRRIDISASYPSVYTNTSTGLTEVRSKMTFSGSFAVPQNIVLADTQEFAAQISNLIASSLFTTSVIAGFAPV